MVFDLRVPLYNYWYLFGTNDAASHTSREHRSNPRSSLSGCLGTAPGGESPHNRIDGVITDPPPDLPIAPAVSVVTAESSAEGPTRIAVTWANGTERQIRFGEERNATFHIATSDDERARLLGDEYGTWNDIVSFGDCWYVSGEVNGDGAYRVVDLEAGGAHRAELDL